MQAVQVNIADNFINKESASLSEIAEQFSIEYGGDRYNLTMNLFRRFCRGEFDYCFTDLIYEDEIYLHCVKATKTFVSLNGESLNWPSDDFTRYIELQGGIKIALKEVCIERCVAGKSVDIDYEELFNKKLDIQDVLKGDHDDSGIISVRHAEMILEKHPGKTVDEARKCKTHLSKWLRKLPEEYQMTPKSEFLEKLPNETIPKPALIELLRRIDGNSYIAEPFCYFASYDLSICLQGNESRNIKQIIADFREEYSKEKDRLFYALAHRIFIDREGFLHWIRLKRNEGLNGDRLDSPTFWGDPWAGYPKPWSPGIDDSDGLVLSDSIIQYSDPDFWIPFNVILNSFNKKDSEQLNYPSKFLPHNIEAYINESSSSYFSSVVDDEKAQHRKYKKIWNRIIADFLENIKQKRIVMKAFVSNSDQRARTEITFNEVEGLFDSNGFDFVNSSAELAGVKYEGIRVYKVKQRFVGKEDEQGSTKKERLYNAVQNNPVRNPDKTTNVLATIKQLVETEHPATLKEDGTQKALSGLKTDYYSYNRFLAKK